MMQNEFGRNWMELSSMDPVLELLLAHLERLVNRLWVVIKMQINMYQVAWHLLCSTWKKMQE